MDESFEYYTKDEIDLIDRCKKITGQNLEDEEIYEIILKHKFNEPQIIDEIVGIADKLRKKGEDYEWNIVQKIKEKVPQKGPKTFYKEKNYYKNKDGKTLLSIIIMIDNEYSYFIIIISLNLFKSFVFFLSHLPKRSYF